MPIDYKSSISKAVQTTRHSFILKGTSGVGKTHQFRKMQEAGLRGLYVNVERKLLTIADLNPDLWHIEQPDFPTSKEEKNPATQDLMRLIDFMRTPDHGYDFVYFDSAMRYAEELLEHLRFVKRLGGQELWGAFAMKLEKALKMLAQLTDPMLPAPVHVIATWGVEMERDWQGNRSVQLLVDGQKVKPKIDYWFDHVLYLDKLVDPLTGANDFVLHTTGNGAFSAKITGALVKFPPIIKDPNIATIISLLTNSGGGGTAAKETPNVK